MLIASLLLALAADPDDAAFRARIARAPKPVRSLVDRREGCTHFAGEEPYDAERRRYLNRMFAELRCSRLEADAKALRKRYAKDRNAIAVLDATADW